MSLSEFEQDQWFAACPKGLEALLAAELASLGATATRETVAGSTSGGPVALAYRACLWSRLANRVLLPIAGWRLQDSDSLYRALQAVDWAALFGPEQSFAIDFPVKIARFAIRSSAPSAARTRSSTGFADQLGQATPGGGQERPGHPH